MPHAKDRCPWCDSAISGSRLLKIEALTRRQTRTTQTHVEEQLRAELQIQHAAGTIDGRHRPIEETMIERDTEFEEFIRSLEGVNKMEPIDGGYRVVVQLASPSQMTNPIRHDVIAWLKQKELDIRVMWELHRPPWIDPDDPTRVVPGKPLIADEYPRYVERPAPDPEFEAFCLSVPDVLGVEIGDEYYVIKVKWASYYPIRRAVYRWMANNGRHFDTAFQRDSTDGPSAYDGMDRAIWTLTYKHKAD